MEEKSPQQLKDQESSTASGKRKEPEWFKVDDERNTHVYVTGLPKNITEEDFLDIMKKYGIIAKKNLPGQPYNIKLYNDNEGLFKGDARCCYVRVESVELALTHLDGYHYDDRHVLHCERAKFELKGSYDPSKRPRVLDKKAKLKQKKTVEKLLSWEPKIAPEVRQKKVILKNMFTPDEIVEDATLMVVLKEEVELKCEEFHCAPKRIDIYEKSTEGVIAITFAEPEQAEKCILAMNNQYYAQRLVKAELWDGKTKYKVKETDEEAQKRLEKWHEDIQKSDDGDCDTEKLKPVEKKPDELDDERFDTIDPGNSPE